MRIAFILALFCSSAFAQTSTTSLDSIIGMKASFLPSTVTLLQGSPGAYQDVGLPTPLTGQFQPTTVTIVSPVAATITGVRATICGKGTNWRVCAPFELDMTTPVVVPAGGSVKLTYNDAFGLAFSGSSATLIASVTPPVVIAPPPAPPPPPPPIVSCSPDPIGTKSPPALQLTSSDCAAWTLSGVIVKRNGVDTKNPFSSPGQTAYIQVGPLKGIRVYRPDGVYNCWSGTAWVGQGC